MVIAEEIVSNFLPLLGGVAGVTFIYAIVMVGFGISRHKREERMELRQQRIERMTRDLWIDWMRCRK